MRGALALEGEICSYVYTAKEKQAKVRSLATRPRATFWLASKLAGAIPSIADLTGEEGWLLQVK